MKEILRITVEEASQVGEARRLAVSFCRSMNLSEAEIGRLSIIVTEMATNLVRHTRGGELLVRSMECSGLTGIEILSIDRGPGMVNPSRSIQDGVSTAGSPGTGLGAIVRLSSQFDIFSEPEKGTVIMSRTWTGRIRREPPCLLEVGAVCLAITDEEPCGDGWAVEQSLRRSVVLVCDGLGHGAGAAEASREAERLFRNHSTEPVQEIVEALHAGLRNTRGAALAVLEANHSNSVVRFCGIGNVSARIIAGDIEKSLTSYNGTAGHEARKIQQHTYPWDESALLVVHSDGIATRWRLADYPGLSARDPSLIAAVLYRDFKRGRDDLTVVTARRAVRRGLAGTVYPPTAWSRELRDGSPDH